MIRSLIIATLVILISCSSESDNSDNTVDSELVDEDVSAFGNRQMFWFYEDDFSKEEQQKLKNWITQVANATIETIGQYPFDIKITFHRSESEGTPVSFGHTERGEMEGIHYYVNPSFSLDAFLEDWTGTHEFSHLSIPVGGKMNKWFSEGYATYISRQIMITMGYFTDESFDSLYVSRIQNTLPYYGSTTKSHAAVSDSLLEHYDYGSMYWGGASYFYQVDQELRQKHAMRLTEVIKEYQDCCRMKDVGMTRTVTSFDKIICDTLFTSWLNRYQNDPSRSVMEVFY